MLTYLHENGCPWDKQTFNIAILKDKTLDILKYLHEKNCPWEKNFFQTAICIKNADVI